GDYNKTRYARSIRWYIFGDQNQCKPVQDYNFEFVGSEIHKFLTGGKVEELKYIAGTGRYTQETYELLTELLKTGTIAEGKLPGLFDDAVFHITATNKTRRELNEAMAKKALEESDSSTVFEVGSRKFCIGMPVIAYENNPGSKIFNSQAFTITGVSDTH